jgi:hypothetical protein
MMKKTIFLCIVAVMIIGSCAREKHSPLEGIWKLTYGNWYNWRQGDTLNYQFPGNMDIYHIKIFSNEKITYVGHYSLDSITYDNFGGGIFTLEGKKYEENLLYAGKAIFSRKTRILMEIDNDTLIQKWPVDENWNLGDKYNIEKYIRLK